MSTPVTGSVPPPLGSTQPRPTRSSADGQAQLAWQHEMERAQVADWFRTQRHVTQGGNGAPATRPADNASPDQTVRYQGGMHHAPVLPAAFVTSTTPTTPVMPHHVSLALSVAVSPLVSIDAVAASPARAAASEAVALESKAPIEQRVPFASRPASSVYVLTPTKDIDEASMQRTTADAPEPPAPLRLHEEQTPRGQALWIGMHAGEELLTTLLPRIVLELQQSQARHGKHLYQIVCNGHLVWRDGEFTTNAGLSTKSFIPDTTQEILWPSTL